MVDIIVFSKDRPLQLYNNLESIKKFVSGYGKVYVMFNYSNEDYKNSYEKLNKLSVFDDIIFVDESIYGFNTTIRNILDILQSEYLLMEIDDEVYCDTIDLAKYTKAFSKHEIGRINFAADYKIYDSEYYTNHEDYLIIDRRAITNPPKNNEELCLWYPFNVSSTLHKVKDVVSLFEVEDIRNPFDLEFKGSASEIFNEYRYNCIVKKDGPIIRQLHINNFLDRYEEYYSLDDLHEIFKQDLVFDLDYEAIKNSNQNVKWLKNKVKSDRFPIFPWDIDPIDYKKILSKNKSIK